ncbi:MAG: DUF222 domain-containing protein, partial [Acidimicrobiia bacterium]|nr:DUF222 domain-containing protein [Acidimicrobiia bacterium]
MTVEAPERPIADLAIAPRQEREVRLGTLSRAVTQSTHTLVMEIAAALIDGGVVGDSSADMRAWLVHNLGHSQATARGLVALAERIGELPRTCTYLEAGAISVDAAIVIARHGATECEAELAELACDVTTSELTRFAKDAKPEPEAHTLDENEYIKEITWFRDEREGWWWINGRLPLADGAVVETALRRIMGGLMRKNEIGQYYPHGMQAAEA